MFRYKLDINRVYIKYNDEKLIFDINDTAITASFASSISSSIDDTYEYTVKASKIPTLVQHEGEIIGYNKHCFYYSDNTMDSTINITGTTSEAGSTSRVDSSSSIVYKELLITYSWVRKIFIIYYYIKPEDRISQKYWFYNKLNYYRISHFILINSYLYLYDSTKNILIRYNSLSVEYQKVDEGIMTIYEMDNIYYYKTLWGDVYELFGYYKRSFYKISGIFNLIDIKYINNIIRDTFKSTVDVFIRQYHYAHKNIIMIIKYLKLKNIRIPKYIWYQILEF